MQLSMVGNENISLKIGKLMKSASYNLLESMGNCILYPNYANNLERLQCLFNKLTLKLLSSIPNISF